VSHYFTDNTDMHHNRKVLSFRFLGVIYQFVSDAGVFSKEQVDMGSTVLLSAIFKHGITANKVLDLGCGYGVLSVVIQKETNADVTAVDINPRAVALTNENALLNKVNIRTIQSDGANEVRNEQYDMVITNPPIRAGKQVVYRFFDQAYELLTDGGTLWVVIRKQHGAKSAVNKLNELFGNCEIVEKEKGYYILKSTKIC